MSSDRQPTIERLHRDALRVLESPWWEPTLEVMTPYSRLHDDDDGGFQGNITVTLSPDGDAWISADILKSLRFRTSAGGGKSLRVRNALMLLALAIKLDEEQPLD
ncbi:MAG: hypothetical protein WC687_03295 [Patescibacteria group bacterium]|jgi:hypothetical protein